MLELHWEVMGPAKKWRGQPWIPLWVMQVQ
jgi:hypothetical protein